VPGGRAVPSRGRSGLTLSSLIDFSLALTPSAAWLADGASAAAGV
jgi:hypothetical protein